MSARKKSKLSLKKKSPPGISLKTPANTIVSMFRNQKQKQGHTKDDSITVTESGSEGDVIITDVVESDNTTAPSSAKVEHLAMDDDTNDTKDENSKRTCDNYEKSVEKVTKPSRLKSKQNKTFRSSEALVVKRGKGKSKLKGHCSDAESDDFILEKSKKKRRDDLVTDGVTPNRKSGAASYSLRKRKTVPIVDASDSELEDEKESKEERNIENEIIDMSDDVIVVEETNSPYFTSNSTNKRKRSGKESKRLSLKKLKTEGDMPKDTSAVSKSFDICKGDESVKGSKEQILSTGANKNKCSASDVKNVSNEDGQQLDKLEDKKPTPIPFKGNFLAKMKSDIEKKQTENVSANVLKDRKNKKPRNSVTVKTGMESEDVVENKSEPNNNKSSKSKPSLNKTNSGSKSNSEKKSKAKGNSTEGAAIDDKGQVSDATENEDDDGDEDNDTGEEKIEYRVPYYLENFRTIVTNVLEDKEYVRLFDDRDMKYVHTFNSVDEACQKLYVRMFSRKLSWLPMSKLSYPEISDNIPQLVDDLIQARLLHSGETLDDLSIVLKILSAADLKALAKSFHINSQGLTKNKISEILVKKGQQSSISTLFRGGASGNMEKTILNRAKTYLGKVCQLNEEARAVFIRTVMLFSLYNTNFDEDSGGGGGAIQLFQMLMVNIGRVTYPSFTVNRQTSVFTDRAALVRFETALQFEMDIESLTEKNKWSAALEVYQKAKTVGTTVCKNTDFLSWDKKLPQFLRLYTASSVYTRIDNQGVEILQKLKQYAAAVALLEELLEQYLYCENYRGHWYERLALNLEAHLKSPLKSLAVIKRGLADKTVRVGRRYALYDRARKLCEAPKSKYADRMKEFEHEPVSQTPEVVIDGLVISDASSMGMKYQFIMQGDSDSVTLCAVEELVLEHYKQNGFPEGLHAEGSIISNLFMLLFWDVMFMDVPDVFHGPYQSCPLDIVTQDFYRNRKQTVDERLQWVTGASNEKLTSEVARIWTEHEGEMCTGINWDKFSGPDTHQHLVCCMGGKIVAGMLERFVKDPRHTRSGFPDLTLWNYETKQLKICEVKGPNDRLSYKQILWIDYLLKLGVDAEVCYVKAVGSKRLKPQSSQEQGD